MIELNKIYCDDCFNIFPLISDHSIDMVLSDLPYGVTARNKWDVVLSLDKLWEQYERIIKDNGIIILTAQQPFTSKLVMSNLVLFRYSLVWEKPLATGFLNANRMPLRSHEDILVFYKKLPTYNPQFTYSKPYKMTRRSDTSNYNEVKVLNWTTESDGKRYPKSVLKFAADKEKLHPTQKPLELFKYLILTYSNKGDIILDNCAGSGTSCLAAKLTERNYIGVEIDSKYCEIAERRIKECEQL